MEIALGRRSGHRCGGSGAGSQSDEPDGRDDPGATASGLSGDPACRAHSALPGTTKAGHEYLVVRTAAGAKAVMLVTVENGPLKLQYGAEKIGKGQQLQVDGSDFPTLAASGLHSPAELERATTITGKPVAEVTRLGRPGMASGIGFLAKDEDIVSVLQGDNELVRRMGLKHPDLACPLFHVWNLLLREYELGKLGRFKDDGGSFWYHGREIHLRSQRTKGFPESIFNDEIKGAFDIELWRELEAGERELLNAAYAHLNAADRNAMIGRLTRLRTGEMQPYYIMRYGFYEGHTEYRVDTIALAAIFGLKSLAEIETAFATELDPVLTRRFTKGRAGSKRRPNKLGAANGSQPIRTEVNRMSSAAGSRR